LNLSYLVAKKHIFKNRCLRQVHKPIKLHLGNSCLFSLKNQRFELFYFKIFKKCIFRRINRRRRCLKKRKVWMLLFPDCILSRKSTNARMGAGVGLCVRLCIFMRMHSSFLEFQGFSRRWSCKLFFFTRYRCPIKYGFFFK
jgi:hypothetical protein